MKSIILIVLLSASATCFSQPVVTDEFVDYMKTVLNPHKYGLKEDRFHPYSTRYGRRVGFGLQVTDKSWYSKGLTEADAGKALSDQLSALVPELDKWLLDKYPRIAFSSLEQRCKEILLDRAFTEGINNLPDDFCRAVLDKNWDKLINGYLYIRQPEGWPDVSKNHAFAQRWMVGKAALIPVR